MQQPEWFEDCLIAIYPNGVNGFFHIMELAPRSTLPTPLYRFERKTFEQAEGFVKFNWDSYRLVSRDVLDQEAEDRKRYVQSESLSRYQEAIRLLDQAMGEIEGYRRNALAAVASGDTDEAVRWLTVMEQERSNANEVVSRLLVLRDGPLQ